MHLLLPIWHSIFLSLVLHSTRIKALWTLLIPYHLLMLLLLRRHRGWWSQVLHQACIKALWTLLIPCYLMLLLMRHINFLSLVLHSTRINPIPDYLRFLLLRHRRLWWPILHLACIKALCALLVP